MPPVAQLGIITQMRRGGAIFTASGRRAAHSAVRKKRTGNILSHSPFKYEFPSPP